MKNALLFVLLLPLFGCTDVLSAGGSEGFTPTRIVASWTGGASGVPNDRTDTEATSFTGDMCPANAIRFNNQTDGAVLTLINDCTILVTLYVCYTKGSVTQPNLGLKECAADPLQTSLSQFSIHPISPLVGGGSEDYRNATPALAINAFFCSRSTTLSTFSDKLECI
jgi:hypothetical protein